MDTPMPAESVAARAIFGLKTRPERQEYAHRVNLTWLLQCLEERVGATLRAEGDERQGRRLAEVRDLLVAVEQQHDRLRYGKTASHPPVQHGLGGASPARILWDEPDEVVALGIVERAIRALLRPGPQSELSAAMVLGTDDALAVLWRASSALGPEAFDAEVRRERPAST